MDEARGQKPDQPDTAMRVFGFILFVCGILCIGRVLTGGSEGDWRSIVLWIGIGIPLLLGGLLLNGWFMSLCVAIAWTLPATILFGGIVLIADPGYATHLDGPKNQMDADWKSYGLGALFVLFGLAGCAGWGYGVKRALARRRVETR